MIVGKINSTEICSGRSRLDGSFHLSEARHIRRQLQISPYVLTTIGNESEGIWHAGRWKRVYVDNSETGITLLGSSAILKSDLTHEKLVSKKYTEGIPDKLLQPGWILISCSGTIGNCAFTNRLYCGMLASQHVIRVAPKRAQKAGLIYAYLASKYGYIMLTQGTSGSVIQHIEPENVENIPLPKFPEEFQTTVNQLILAAARLREEAADELEQAEKLLKERAGLRKLTLDDYDYFGQHSADRKPSCFIRKFSEISSTTVNAFNYSERITRLRSEIQTQTKLRDVLENNGTFTTGAFPRIEVPHGNGLMLVNQSDAFDIIIKGKSISTRNVNMTKLVEYGEIVVAGVGTLGENETFCRVLFANEDLQGQLISGEFIRMKTNGKVPAGYLYAWLNSDHGFRLIRNTQAGTKLCRPIPNLFLDIPVPIIDKSDMEEIDRLVKTAHTKRHEANVKELEAIAMVEHEIESWK